MDKTKEKINASDGGFLLYCNCSFHPWMYYAYVVICSWIEYSAIEG